MSFVSEYIQLKHKYTSIKTNIGGLREKSLLRISHENRLKTLKEQISHLEQEDEDVKTYIHLKQRCASLKKKIAINRYYGHSVTSIEGQLKESLDQLQKYEQQESDEKLNDDLQKITNYDDRTIENLKNHQTTDKSLTKTNKNPNKESQKIPKQKIQIKQDPSYYIINLAWTNTDQKILDNIRRFLDKSTYMKYEESANMMTWKFFYDTIEEQSLVKALQISSVHLLQVFKELFDQHSDAEIFGKIQNY